MAVSAIPVRLAPRRFGETARRDLWWVYPLAVAVGLSTFVVYATWAAFQGEHYTYGPYLSPFYSPEIFGDSPHSWFGPQPAAWPSWLPFSPALLILPIPGLFRFTCYYYRGAYYKAFWADPPACTVGEPRSSYWGENSFPLILQNIHRYMLFISVAVLAILVYRRLACLLVHRSGDRHRVVRDRRRHDRPRGEHDPPGRLSLRLPLDAPRRRRLRRSTARRARSASAPTPA